MSKLATIRAYTHYFEVESHDLKVLRLLDGYRRRLTLCELEKTPSGRSVMVPKTVFASPTNPRFKYRFHIHCLRHFIDYLKDSFISMEMLDAVAVPAPSARPCGFKIKEGWAPRDDLQRKTLEHIVRPFPNKVTLVEIQTGKGKSYLSLEATARLNLLSCYVMRPSYIEKWVLDIQKTCDLGDNHIYVVQGSHQLKELIALAALGDTDYKPGVILVSNKTFHAYMKLYEEQGDEILNMGYACTPLNFFETIGAGYRIIDEVHQDFHFNFLLDLCTNVQRTLSLSATLEHKDETILKYYNLAYPPYTRAHKSTYDCYARGFGVSYQFQSIERWGLRFKGHKGYSHTTYEKSLLRTAKTRNAYFDMIVRVLDWSHFQKAQTGEKVLIYVSTIRLAGELITYLKKIYPNLKIARYMENDDYDDVLTSDITVSSLGKAGAAIDIPDLRTVINTVAVDSVQANTQSLGRLRKNSKFTPTYVWTYCRQISKHVVYHNNRKYLFRNKLVSYSDSDIGFIL